MSYNSKYTGAEVEAKLDIVGRIPVIEHGTADTDIELTPNALHKWDEVTSLALTFPTDAGGTRSEYKVAFIAGEGFSLSVPLNMRWANDEIPEFETGKQYEMSIFDKRILVSAFGTPLVEGEVLNYIESDGVDYILTDIYPDSTFYGFRAKSATLWDAASSASYGVAGTRNVASGSNNAPFCYYYHYSRGRLLYWSNKDVGTLGDYVKDEVYEDEYILASGIATAAQYPLAIFAVNSKGTIGAIGAIRLYYLQFIGATGKVIHDLRPFRRASDNAVGLIDVVNDFFYPSVNGNLKGA